MIPPTLVALAGLVAARQLRQPVYDTKRRADQLYNGEFARGVQLGRAEERANVE